MSEPRIVVIGAGVLGAWTAWHLAQRGAQVTLIDAWGPANSRSTSGDETRVIRGAYGAKAHYVRMTAQSFGQWESLQERCGRQLLRRTGVLWLFDRDDSFVTDSLPALEQGGFPVEKLDLGSASARFPQINLDGVRNIYLEERAGCLLARRSVQELVLLFEQAGGIFRREQAALEFSPNSASLDRIRFGDGTKLVADRYVFACGPWLRGIFPEWIGPWLQPTRQEVFYFGPPAGDPAFHDPAMPAWLDNAQGSTNGWYGIPGNENRGFKISCNDLGEVVDPSTVDRTPDPGRLMRARGHLAFRFPGMAGAPLLESRVCQYENTPDRDLIIDLHPTDPRVLAVGGGSGHSFKLGPAVGELAARISLGEQAPPDLFRLARFATNPDDPNRSH